MSTHTDALLERLAAIGKSLERSGQAVALLGMGSVGLERDRLDDYSDIDFFAIVQPGQKAHYIEHLEWLTDIYPVDYYFRNTVDGFKLLYADGIFCEFAVLEADELKHIPYAPGSVAWSVPDFDRSLAIPPSRKPGTLESTVEWQLGEALTNLYVGLGRFHRGEKLSAQRFIEHFAVDRALELAKQIEAPRTGHVDPFMTMRRFEQLYPLTSAHLGAFVQGYGQSKSSAKAILMWLDEHFDVNPGIKARILALCE
ncbi:MAG: hypothetical protein U0670_21555 [Anaerolineae bacterium]